MSTLTRNCYYSEEPCKNYNTSISCADCNGGEMKVECDVCLDLIDLDYDDQVDCGKCDKTMHWNCGVQCKASETGWFCPECYEQYSIY